MIYTDNPAAWAGFTEQQLDPGWREWIGGQHARRLEEFYAQVPLPVDRYSSAGLCTAEHCLLARCTESTVPESTTAHDSLVDGYARFLGEVLVHSLDGQWFHEPDPANPESVRATILFPYTASRVHVTDWVHRALHARTGRVWTGLHAGLTEWCSVWWQSGRTAAGTARAEDTVRLVNSEWEHVSAKRSMVVRDRGDRR